MTQLTEIFNGTPSQFWGVMQDFVIDQGATFSWISVKVYDPVRPEYDRAPMPLFPSRQGHDSDILDQMFGNRPRYVPDVHPDTDRVVVEVRTRDELIYLTATLRDGKSKIRAHGDECDATPIWTPIVDYLRNMGWVDGAQAVPSVRPVGSAQHGRSLLDTLTTKEASILQLIVDGLSKEQIAMTEGVEPGSIMKRQQQIAGKLEIDGKATFKNLLLKGLELGLKRRPETIERFTPKV